MTSKLKWSLLLWFCLGAIFWVFLSQIADAALSDCIDATCRITVPAGGNETNHGTGVVFEISKGNVYVLTNAHVATATTVQLEFWSQGHQSRFLSGTTIMRSAAADAAVVRIDAAKFGGRLPTAMPIDRSGQSMRAGQTILSVGCANGAWSTGWRGHAIRDDGANLYFLPTPAFGRSGSAIFDAAGEKIVGLLRGFYDGKQGGQPHGIATSAARICSVFASPSGERQTQQQCGPNGCPTDNKWRLSPYRFGQDQRNDAQDERIDSLYPTMPPQQQLLPAPSMVPVAPIVVELPPPSAIPPTDRYLDLVARITSLERRLDAIANAQPQSQDIDYSKIVANLPPVKMEIHHPDGTVYTQSKPLGEAIRLRLVPQ